MAKKVPVGLMLWNVHFSSSYYDNDARMPGMVPVNERFFVVAKTRDEALAKAEPGLAKLRKEYDGTNKVTASIVTLDELIPARDCSGDGRLGFHPNHPIGEVKIYGDDTKHFRLAVCLIPVE